MALNTNVIPWGLHPLDPWVKDELDNRSREIGMNVPSSTGNGLYSGPKTAWVRFFSNGMTPIIDPATGLATGYSDKNGFTMYGVNGFDQSYGFTSDGKQTLGFDCNGDPIKMDASGISAYPHRPPPSVESVEISLYGGQNASFSGLCRKAHVNWKCYSLDQLNLLAPYFLVPKVTAVVEWGWNNYNPASLIDLSNPQEMADIFFNGVELMNKISQSKGNYDAMLGFIFDYGFSMNSVGGYDCYTEFVNANWLIEGQEYKSTSQTKQVGSGRDATFEPMKTFVEFVDTDINNLTLVNKSGPNQIYKFNTAGRTFVNSDRKWIRMDLVQDIFNQYFSLVFKTIDGRKVGQGLVLDIHDAVICGHPALKSIDEDVLIPNQFAPRLTTKTNDATDKTLSSIKTNEISDYYKTFSKTGIQAAIKNRQLTDAYDDLRILINKDGGSFPQFVQGTGTNKYSKAGMWGYLKDIFVSTELIQKIVEKNDTAFRMLQDLCETINNAFCGIVQLKIMPHQIGAMITVVDMNYNPNYTSRSVLDLVKFTPGSINSAYMTDAKLTVRLSQEMANQMVAQSSAKAMVNSTYQRVGVQRASRFMGSDRLYDVGLLPEPEPSDASPVADSSNQNKESVSSREFSDVGGWYFYKDDKSNKFYILVDPNSQFMKEILTSDESGTAIYMNSPLMPGTKFDMETLGIGGFTLLGQFTLDHVPPAYAFKRCVWQIGDIKQVISPGGVWKTMVTADCRPLSYITT